MSRWVINVTKFKDLGNDYKSTSKSLFAFQRLFCPIGSSSQAYVQNVEYRAIFLLSLVCVPIFSHLLSVPKAPNFFYYYRTKEIRCLDIAEAYSKYRGIKL